jgi:hypothetical protein
MRRWSKRNALKVHDMGPAFGYVVHRISLVLYVCPGPGPKVKAKARIKRSEIGEQRVQRV